MHLLMEQDEVLVLLTYRKCRKFSQINANLIKFLLLICYETFLWIEFSVYMYKTLA